MDWIFPPNLRRRKLEFAPITEWLEFWGRDRSRQNPVFFAFNSKSSQVLDPFRLYSDCQGIFGRNRVVRASIDSWICVLVWNRQWLLGCDRCSLFLLGALGGCWFGLRVQLVCYIRSASVVVMTATAAGWSPGSGSLLLVLRSAFILSSHLSWRHVTFHNLSNLISADVERP
jgi:hypothetical protein